MIKFVSVEFNPNSFDDNKYLEIFEGHNEDSEKKAETPISPFTKYLEIRLSMMQKILKNLESTEDFEEITNSMIILKDFCNRFNIISDQKEVFEKFYLNKDNLSTLTNILLTSVSFL